MLALLKLDSKHCIGQCFEDFGHHFYRLFLCHTYVERSLALTGKLHIIACTLHDYQAVGRVSSRGNILESALRGRDTGKYLRPFFRNSDCMFSVGTGQAVHGCYCPPVLQNPGVMRADINHRLDCENISRFYLRPLPGSAIVWNLRVLVHPPAYSMAYVITHHRIPVPLSIGLHGGAYIADVISGATIRRNSCSSSPSGLAAARLLAISVRDLPMCIATEAVLLIPSPAGIWGV